MTVDIQKITSDLDKIQSKEYLLTETASDTCENYLPDPEKPTKITSKKSGRIYLCKNYGLKEKNPPPRKARIQFCSFCKNRKTKSK